MNSYIVQKLKFIYWNSIIIDLKIVYLLGEKVCFKITKNLNIVYIIHDTKKSLCIFENLSWRVFYFLFFHSWQVEFFLLFELASRFWLQNSLHFWNALCIFSIINFSYAIRSIFWNSIFYLLFFSISNIPFYFYVLFCLFLFYLETLYTFLALYLNWILI